MKQRYPIKPKINKSANTEPVSILELSYITNKAAS
jgi:hypothetical protein